MSAGVNGIMILEAVRLAVVSRAILRNRAAIAGWMWRVTSVAGTSTRAPWDTVVPLRSADGRAGLAPRCGPVGALAGVAGPRRCAARGGRRTTCAGGPRGVGRAAAGAAG